MIEMIRKVFIIGLFVMISFYPRLCIAQTEPDDKFKEAIGLITESAERLCGSIAHGGTEQSFSVQGNINTELLALLKNLGNLGISGTGTYSQKNYEGVVQNQLADALRDERQCKEHVLSILIQNFITPRQSTLRSARLTYDRIEPYQIPFISTDGKDLGFTGFKLWFKNVGQSAAQNEILAANNFVKDGALSNKEEEDVFNSLSNASDQVRIIMNDNDIQPGNSAYFISHYGLSNDAWANFNKSDKSTKFLYVMSILY